MAIRSRIREALQRFMSHSIAFKPRPIQSRSIRKQIGLTIAACSLALTALGVASWLEPQISQASDHDDGDIDVRSRALSLTDLYVFREQDVTAATTNDLIFVMNTNPRSLARQQYFFSSAARYEFRVTRVNGNNSVPTGTPDVTLRFTFGEPTGSPRRQQMTLTVIDSKGTVTASQNISGNAMLTTPLASSSSPRINEVNVRGSKLSVFAGLREDPFFFDVEQFFRVRAGLLGKGPAVGFRAPEDAVDFATGYNVNTIVVRVPRQFLQGGTNATTFDVWLSLLIQDPRTQQFVQTEQLARPGINEALLFSQSNLAAYNRTQPSRNVPPGVASEATRVLLALGNNNARATALLGAFIPDVMRIDTTGPSGFANALNSRGAPIRGRLLSDDVIDVAFAVLTNGAVTTDNVSYTGVPGNPGQGHDPLSPTFPYLAPPN